MSKFAKINNGVVVSVIVPPKNYDSWIFNNETFDWEAPIPCPTDGAVYRWSEDQKDWVKLQEEIA